MYNISCKEQYSINRNIVECKDHSDAATPKPGDRINRNIVECKADTGTADSADRGSVLIETLWNVKYMKNGTMQDLGAVLIETLWNVKTVHPVPANASCSVY